MFSAASSASDASSLISESQKKEAAITNHSVSPISVSPKPASTQKQSPQGAQSNKSNISAADLVASLHQEKVFSQEDSSSELGARRRIDMPPVRPMLNEEPTESEAFLEELALEELEAKSARRPGVDGRRPFEPAPIDPPTPQQRPTLRVSGLGPSGEAARAAATSVAMIRGKLDPQLARVMDAWPTMPQRTREAILAMIDISLGKR